MYTHVKTKNKLLNMILYVPQAGTSLQDEKDFPARLRTRNPGQGIIRVTVKCPPGLCVPDEGTFIDQVEVRVFAPLRLINPFDGQLLLPQNGNTRIRTNRFVCVFFLQFNVLLMYMYIHVAHTYIQLYL